MNKIFTPHLAGACSLVLAASFSAWSAPIRLNESHLTTVVSRGQWGINGLALESRTTESSVPISDSLVSEGDWLNSRSEVDLLRISSYAASDYPLHDSATASAKSELSFSPEASAVVPISIEATGWGHWYFSLGNVALYDLTTGTTLWNFDWNGQSGTMPWSDHGDGEPRATASLTLNTELLESHNYKLTLFSWVNSQEPSSPHVLLQVSGIEVVPEPSMIALMSFAGIGLMAVRSRRK